ncbi:MAG: TolB family protein, partial [Planctomycetota bacterium]
MRRLGFVTCLLMVFLASPAVAADQPYMMPPKDIADIIDAPPTPSVEVSPFKKWMLLKERPSLPSIEEISQPELRLAGLRINPRTNGPSRRSHNTKLILKNLSTLEEKEVDLPEGARIGNTAWSPDGERIAFTLTGAADITLWVLEVQTAQARQVLDASLNAVGGSPYSWLSDSKTLIVKILPEDRSAPPSEPLVPEGPVVQENLGRKAPARTFQDLLKSPHDEALFDHYLTSQIVRVSLDGEATPIGPSAIVMDASPSPDGKLLLVEILHKPYSYIVPFYRFPRRVEVWDLDGKVVHLAADLPEGARIGNTAWSPDGERIAFTLTGAA